MQSFLWSNAVFRPIDPHCIQFGPHATPPRQIADDLIQADDADDLEIMILCHFLHGRACALPALLPINGDRGGHRLAAVAPDDIDRFQDRRAGGDHIINDQHPPADGPAEDQPAFAVILDFLAAATERVAGLILFLEGDRERRRERDPLVGRAINHIEAEPGAADRGRVKSAERGQALAVIKTTVVEKIGTQAPGFQSEFAEAQHLFFDGEFNKRLLIILHSDFRVV